MENKGRTKADFLLYLEKNVLTAAKERIKHIIFSFDTLYVCFSGGKDSWVLLNLVDEVYKELGIKEKVKVIFRDEELIQGTVIDFVNSVRLSGRFDFRYYCIPLVSEKYILGNKETYIQWDPNRKHIRPIPEYAITSTEVMSQYTSDLFITQGGKGRIGLLIGIRASESIIRLSSLLRKKNECYISDSDYPNIKKCKPLYDWEEADIFRYFYDREIPYCKSYDYQMFAGASLRVSTPLHAESAKHIAKVRESEPLFYEQVCDIFPEVRLQERYFHQLDRYAIIYSYPRSFQGIYQYISDNITDEKQRAQARKVVHKAEEGRRRALEEGKHDNPYGGYPVLYVFKSIVNGSYKRPLMPKGFNHTTQIEKNYENPKN